MGVEASNGASAPRPGPKKADSIDLDDYFVRKFPLSVNSERQANLHCRAAQWILLSTPTYRTGCECMGPSYQR